MDTEVQRQEKGLGKVSGGLDSLAAAASRGVENIGIEEELDFKDERTEKSGELHGQKGKVRKAYTITKQRERWTDGEHDRFLQALKRYGRAWRKIEEHIGTKTAVQIRSHAQKFFSKLQREQSQSGAVGEESSKADISIPPPRPKRKPNHPYPRKYNASSENEHSGDGETEKHTPSLPTQPSSTPSYLTPHSFRPANTKGTPDMSLSQILESAAAAAAFAWSQVVANAAPKVQQQLQAHVAAHQSSQTMQPLFSMQPQQESIAAQAMTFQQQPEQLHRPVAKNMHSGSQNLGSQNLSNQFVPSSQGKSIYSSASLGTLRNISPRQESPEARGITLGNERDSASSKEHSQEGGRPVSRPGANSSFQGVNQLRSGQNANPLEMRLGKSALNLMARSKLQTLLKLPAYQPPSQHLNRAPYRAFSAGPAPSQGHSHKPEEASGLPKARPAGDEKAHSPTGRSNISQLAQYYQQAAAEEQQAAENGENGSSAGGSGDLGSSAREDKGSDKGSNNNDTNANNASGSEDGQGIGSGSDRTATAERLARYSKGSDDGSNSPPGMPQRSPNAENNDKAAANIAATMLFNMGGVMEPPCMPTPPPSWNAQRGSTPQFPSELPNTQALPRVLSAQQLAAYQQQALQAWAVTAQQSLPNFQLLQGLALAAQAQTSSGVKNEPSIALTPGAVSPQLEPKSSDVPSMDTYNGSNPSFSIPGLNATEPDGKKRSQLSGSGYQKGEEQSGFKPYSKKHGMPISSLPPSKRFAATTNIDRPLAVKPQGFQGLYTPFGSFNAQGNKMFPAAK